MEYILENEYLKLTVSSHGAEPVSVISKKDREECLWQGDSSIWGRHAPILFPYTGKLPNGEMIVDGRSYAGGQHGFARDLEHSLKEQTKERIIAEHCVPLISEAASALPVGYSVSATSVRSFS